MSAFDLAADHDSLSLADQARANPLDLSQPAGFFSGMGTGAVTGVGRLLADTQRTTGLVTMQATVHNQRRDLVLDGKHVYLLRLKQPRT